MKKHALLPTTVLAALAVAAVAACSDPPPPPAPAPVPAPTPAPAPPPPAPVPTDAVPAAAAAAAEPSAAAVAEADTIFTTRCAACHGVTGMGDGLAAQALNPKPRAYSDKAWQASVTDEMIAKVIVEGGPSIGKAATMTPNADLKDKPDVVKALVAKIRSYNK